MLLIFTFPHFKTLTSKGPIFLLLFKSIITSDDLAVILSSQIRVAWDGRKLLLFFLLLKLRLLELVSLSSSNSSKLGFISSKFIKGEVFIFSSEFAKPKKK